MRTAWSSPTYLAQSLTGAAAIGAIFADGDVTRLRIYLAAIAALAMIASLFVAASVDAASRRTRQDLETLLLAMELPYFIVEKLSKIIMAVAREHGWSVDRKEHRNGARVYFLKELHGPAIGHLVTGDDEFKRVWIHGEHEGAKYFDARMFDPSPNSDDAQRIEDVVQDAVYAQAEWGEHWAFLTDYTKEGFPSFAFRQRPDGPMQEFLRIPVEQQEELKAMIPIRRYAVIADDARTGLLAQLRPTL